MTSLLNNLYKRYRERKQQDPHVVRAVELIKKVVGKHRNSTYVSFNGGKDATVVLFLTVLAYHEYAACYLRLQLPPSQIQTLFFVEPQPFEEVDDFMDRMHQLLGYQQLRASRNFKDALHELKRHKKIDSIIMGTRRSDPHCQQLQEISPSDVLEGYPQFDRINPIIDWKYCQVWNFLRQYELPYCQLYQQGYTYLGNKSNTVPNPHLQLKQQDKKYGPAWEASDGWELLSRK